jgi:hypothetical protein
MAFVLCIHLSRRRSSREIHPKKTRFLIEMS